MVDSEAHDDLRATADDIIADAEELKAIEQSKLEQHPASAVMAELSADAEEVSQRIAIKVGIEKQLADSLIP
ncbi:MAG TPA: hypothetical protein VEX62_03960 [Candidatus Limnocylindrales bacterium]|nr:hypothetical protein [Candidatus Limnocylindrales bacterium]